MHDVKPITAEHSLTVKPAELQKVDFRVNAKR